MSRIGRHLVGVDLDGRLTGLTGVVCWPVAVSFLDEDVDPEELLDDILNKGKVVFSHDWDSGGPRRCTGGGVSTPLTPSTLGHPAPSTLWTNPSTRAGS